MKNLVFIPEDSFWCSKTTPNFIIFFISGKGIVLAKKPKFLDDYLTLVGENILELPGMSTINFLYLLNPNELEELLCGSIFIPFTERAKFWDHLPSGLRIDGEKIIQCIPRIELLVRRSTSDNWQSMMGKFWIKWPRHVADYKKSKPDFKTNPVLVKDGVSVFAKIEHALAYADLIEPKIS